MVSYARREKRMERAQASLRPNRSKKKRQGPCTYCQREMSAPGRNESTSFTHDHVKPKSRGGRITVPCCRACNELKADKSITEWRLFMDTNPKWWRLWGCKSR